MRGISWLAEDLLASQEGLCFMELVMLSLRMPPFWLGYWARITECSCLTVSCTSVRLSAVEHVLLFETRPDPVCEADHLMHLVLILWYLCPHDVKKDRFRSIAICAAAWSLTSLWAPKGLDVSEILCQTCFVCGLLECYNCGVDQDCAQVQHQMYFSIRPWTVSFRPWD
jgi:hypothetical protein